MATLTPSGTYTAGDTGNYIAGSGGNYTTGTACYVTQGQVWCQDNGTSAADNVWQAWNSHPMTGDLVGGRSSAYHHGGLSDTVGSAGGMLCADVFQAPRELTPEERAEREAAQAAVQRREAELRREREDAEARAERLLLETLSPLARVQYLANGTVTVIAKSGRVYAIAKGRARNVYELDPATRARRSRLCAHPVDGVPDQDTMLAQKLMLEHAEEEFLAMANRSAV
jgi:hypothetical protein